MSNRHPAGLRLFAFVFIAWLLAACNLTTSDPVVEPIFSTSTATPDPRTPIAGLVTITPLPTISRPTLIGGTVRPPQFPTAIIPPPISGGIPTSNIVVVPPAITSVPVNIAIISPVPSSIIAGSSVQILGSASHPNFLQYQVEFGPDPNPNNLWYLVTNPVLQPVQNGLLGIWNTVGLSDSTYQIRLRVFLRDGTTQQTSVGSLRVQNTAATPVPSPTVSIPRPIAAFSSSVTTGQAPLSVSFFNQSVGDITGYNWNFGDGSSSADRNPVHVFSAPGVYNVTLTVLGPGGTSNVGGQINVQSASAPSANFLASSVAGTAPLSVQFTDQSSGTITSYFWNFSDGSTSSDRNPAHTFSLPGTYNVLLTVTGPGGSSFTSQTISVQGVAPTTAPGEGTPLVIPTQAPAEGTPLVVPTEPPGEGTPLVVPTAIAVVPTDIPTDIPLPTETPIPPTEAPTVPPVTISDMQPVQPSYGDPSITGSLRQIYDGAVSAGAPVQPNLVSAAGDGLFAGGSVWTPFGAPGYNVNGDSGLQSTIDFLSSDPDGDGTNSFNAPGAVNPGASIAQLMDSALADPSICLPGETPVACQARRAGAGVMLISIGYNDALMGTSAGEFSDRLTVLISSVRSAGAIPLLVTVPLRPDSATQIRAINDAILNVANAAQVPVVNLTPVLNALPNFGLDGSGTMLSVAPSGAGDLSAAGQYGANAANLEILRALAALRGAIFPETLVP